LDGRFPTTPDADEFIVALAKRAGPDAVMHGIAKQDFPGLERMQAMPGFAASLSDQDIADLATWMRAIWGGIGSAVTAAEVAQLRRSH